MKNIDPARKAKARVSVARQEQIVKRTFIGINPTDVDVRKDVPPVYTTAQLWPLLKVASRGQYSSYYYR